MEESAPYQPRTAIVQTPTYERSQYSYKSKALPGKPKVITIGDELSVTLKSGVSDVVDNVGS
jgi:hypothetical protein